MQPCPFAAAEAVNDARRRSGASLLTAHDLAHLALRPVVVAWVPEKIYPGVSVKCPNCKRIASPARWCRTRILHGLERQSAYITKEYICYSCEAEPRLKHARGDGEAGGPKRRKQRAFQAEDGIRDSVASRGLGDVYKRQYMLRTQSALSRCSLGKATAST